MKVVVFMLIAVAAVGYGVYYVGGAASFDPAKQGREHRDKIKPGMSWTQVLDIAPSPSQLVTFSPDPKTKQLRASPSSFDRKLIDNGVKANDFQYGFGFFYQYTAGMMFNVVFDPSGKVIDVGDEDIANKLLK